MIQVIIFDLAGVFITNSDFEFFEWLAEKSKKGIEEIEQQITPLMHKSERNEITELQFLREFFRQIGINNEPREAMRLRRALTKEKPKIQAFIRQLKRRYRIAFATNNAQTEFEGNNRKFHYYDLFDYGIASFMVGARKTGPKIFKNIIEHFNVAPEEVVFIDDSEKNLIVPKELGMHTICYVSLEQCKKELEKLGVRV